MFVVDYFEKYHKYSILIINNKYIFFKIFINNQAGTNIQHSNVSANQLQYN